MEGCAGVPIARCVGCGEKRLTKGSCEDAWRVASDVSVELSCASIIAELKLRGIYKGNGRGVGGPSKDSVSGSDSAGSRETAGGEFLAARLLRRNLKGLVRGFD